MSEEIESSTPPPPPKSTPPSSAEPASGSKPERSRSVPQSDVLASTAVLAPPPPGIPHPETVVDGGPAKTAAPSKPIIVRRKDKPAASWGEVGLVLLIGFLGNVALRTTLGGFAATVASLLAVVLVGRRVQRRDAYVPLGLVVVLAPWLMIRSSPALTGATFFAIAVLLVLAAGFSLRGSMFDAQVRQFVSHLLSPMLEWLYGTAMVQRLLRTATAEQRFLPMLRGVVVAVPVVIVFGALLASADEVFASLLLLDNIPEMVGHLILTAIIGVFLLGLLSRAAHVTADSGSSLLNLRILGPVEVLIILGSVVVLFGAFVLTQVAVAVGGADHVLVTEGLTQAEHARSGFFQLLWVAALSIGLVGAVRAGRELEPEKGVDRFKVLALATLSLTFVIAAVSIQRVLLYIDSFGLWQLRLWGLFGAVTVATAIVVFAISIFGWRNEQSWFPGAMAVLLAALVLSLNVVNPDALVASYNLDHGKDIDVWRLSDDAVPALLEEADTLDVFDRPIGQILCQRSNRDASYGFLEYNWAEVRADSLLDSTCEGRANSNVRGD